MYKNYLFDLYGTLVDIHTDEGKKAFGIVLRIFLLCMVQNIKQRNFKVSIMNFAKKQKGCSCHKVHR